MNDDFDMPTLGESLDLSAFVDDLASRICDTHAPHANPEADATSTASGFAISQSQSQSPGCKGRRFVKGSGGVGQKRLPADAEYQLERLLKAIGTDADEGTEGVLRWAARGLPYDRIARVRESLELFKPRNRARYAVGALKSEVAESRAA